MDGNEILKVTLNALDDLKARESRVIDVSGLTSITDYMVIASGTSDRHVRSIADHLLEEVKAAGLSPLGVEGMESGEWVLVDLQDVVVHIMQPETRDFYKLENLWEIGDDDAGAHSA
ncbi:MAG TPA: ribosome silencing factor [Chromatiales bacterium]|nr:ribosome silencing factor [Chromatiales bacterium]